MIDFDYIDRAVVTAMERHAAAPALERAEAAAKSTKVVAGFHLRDEEAEDEAIEEALGRQREAVEAFNADRKAAMELCAAADVKPLAIVPAATWDYLCEATGLFRLSPAADGAVNFDGRAFAGLKDERGLTAAEQVEWLARHDWGAYLRRLFPGGVSPASGPQATLVMPLPPAEVALTLLKAKDLPLKVATVAEAISFKETPSQLYRRLRIAEEEARAKALRDDPIVYFELGAAVAVVAQFGDFPIERQLVDRLLSAEMLMRYFPGQVR